MASMTKVGIIGGGNIFPQYINGCRDYPNLDVVAIADMNMDVANARANEYGLKALTVEAMLADPDISIIVNLTVPAAHSDVDLQILAAGKHVYSEKPLALNGAIGKTVLDAAAKAGLRVSCAPDTFLGGGIQTCRKLIDDGAIGTPVAGVAFMMTHGWEGWHPNPFFYYSKGGGPLYDMGPYYLTALVNLLGPVASVTASNKMNFATRTAGHPQHAGKTIPVEVNTHVAGILNFASGAIITLVMSFDVWQHTLHNIELYGTDGSMRVPDPNMFTGKVEVWHPAKHTAGQWESIALTHRDDIGRGTGVADLAYAIEQNRPQRASGDLAQHVLDVMDAIEEASAQQKYIPIASTVDRPAAIPAGLPKGVLD